MSKSSDAAPVRTRRVRARAPAGETVVLRHGEIERRVHTVRELDRGDRGARPRYRYRRVVWHWLFAAIDAIGWLVFRIAALLRLRRESQAAAALDEVRSLLLVQLDHLGDGVLTCSVLPALRKRFPDACITALVSPSCLELFRDRPEIDEVILCDRNRFSREGRRAGWIGEVFRLGRALRPQRFDVAIDFRGEFPHALLMWLAGSRVRVGWDCGGGGFLLTHHVPYVPHRHEVLSRWAVVKPLGVARPRSVASLGPRYASRQSSEREAGQPAAHRRSRSASAHSATGSLTISETPRVVVCHLGAGTSAKRWPLAKWKRFIRELTTTANTRVVLVGGEADRAAAESIVAEFQSQAADLSHGESLLNDHRNANVSRAIDRVENRIGAGSLATLWEMVSEADLVVGADSGPAHIAAAAGRPTLTLFSGTNDVRQWRPWGADARVIVRPTLCSPCHRTDCPLADHPCLAGLSPDVVLAEALDILQLNDANEYTEPALEHADDEAYPRFPASMYRRVRGERPSRTERLLNAATSRRQKPQRRSSHAEPRLTKNQAAWLAAWSVLVLAFYVWRVVLGGALPTTAPSTATGSLDVSSPASATPEERGADRPSALRAALSLAPALSATRGDG